jgi:hypothetical protein
MAAGGFTLPDGRAWELVSPPNKDGAPLEVMTILGDGGLIQGAEDGSGIAYLAGGPTEASVAGNPARQYSQVLSRRGPGGWSSQDIATPHESVINIVDSATGESEYKLFSSDLSVGLVEPLGGTPLPPLPAGAGGTTYLRDDASGGYIPLPPGLSFEGASPDLSHVVLGAGSLYEWSGGQLQLVSLLPRNAEGKEETSTIARLGDDGRPGIVRHAISADGSRVVWKTGISGDNNHLYMRDTVRGETVQLDAVQPGAEGSGRGHQAGGEYVPFFQSANTDGSKVFFTDGERLTVGSQAGLEDQDLYVFEVSAGGGPLSGTLRDLTPEGRAGESADVLGVLPGASEDGSYVYFVATGVLAAGATGGAPNMYVDHYGSAGWEAPRFVAVLSGADPPYGGDGPDWKRGWSTSRVSPNGRFLAFMSSLGLTGYDNRDAVSGAPDEEVYLYDASTGRLVCASCNPSGARPDGIFDRSEFEPGGKLLIDHIRAWNYPSRAGSELWLDGSIPTWTSVNSIEMLYQSRYLSDNGRLFFNSSSALVPGDVNGKEDVYEYEPVGIGGCEESMQESGVVFSQAAGGCVGLISSGTSGEESVFFDASVSGGDVFFLTAAQLSPLDVDGAFDVYDAHECTSASPCPATASAFSPACETAEACRGAGSAPAVFGAPVTAGVTGSGNAPAVAAAPVVVGRSLSRAQKLARALRACRKEPRRRRVACEVRARRAYKATSARARRVSSARSGR